MNANNQDYLTTRQVAEQLSVHIITVRRWIAAGVLPSVRFGGNRSRLFIPADAIASKLAQE